MTHRDPPYIIAEMGSCWLYGDRLAHGLQLIRHSADAGASAVKTQWCSDPRAMAARRHVPEQTYDYLEWPYEWHRLLRAEARRCQMDYLSTVYLPQDVPTLAAAVDQLKIASLEFGDYALVDACLGTGKAVLVSTGACSLEDVVDFKVRYCDVIDRDLFLLHCVAAYPVPMAEANLAVIEEIDAVGYSDHTGHALAGALAVASGARILEVHVRLDGTPQECPDYGHSLLPDLLRYYVAAAHECAQLLGDGVKRIMPCERALLAHRVQP